MSYFRHPDDEPTPRFGGWADDFNTFEDACNFYGLDTPRQIAAEMAEREREEQAEYDAFIGPRRPQTEEIPF